MANKHSMGLTKVEMGDVAGDGGMGTALAEVGNTLSGTFQFLTAEGTKTDINIEESDAPAISSTKAGVATIKWSCIDVSADTLVKLFGGTKVAADPGNSIPEQWKAPAAIVAKEQSFKVTSPTGQILAVVRASVFPLFNWSFTKDKPAQVDITATILAPTKAATEPFTITYTI